MPCLNVVVIDDHAMFLESLVLGLPTFDDIEVLSGFTNLDDFQANLSRLQQIDVVLVDIDLGTHTGTDVAPMLTGPTRPSVLLMSGLTDDETLAQALDASCSGFISKTETLGELIQAIRTVARGATVYPRDLLEQIAHREDTPLGVSLTNREQEVLGLLARGRSPKEIAGLLHVSVNTARNYIASLRTKLNARSQLEAVVIGAQSGLVKIG